MSAEGLQGEDMLPHALAERARGAGIALAYTSFWGAPQAASRDTVEAILQSMEDGRAFSSIPPASSDAQAFIATEGEATTIALTRAGPWRLISETSQTVGAGTGDAVALPASLPAGYYRLLTRHLPERLVIVAPARCWLPDAVMQGERWWGVSAQLYALRSGTNWGIGDFADLRELISLAAAEGASFVGLNPLHALSPLHPEVASPYSPSSRIALHPLYIDVPGVPEFAACDAARELVASSAFQQRLAALREGDFVKYAEVAAVKNEVLALLWRHFCQRELQQRSQRGRAFERFMQQHRATLGRHALHEALALHLHAADSSVWGWPAWPAGLQEPDSPEVTAFSRAHSEAVAYRFWLQWVTSEQLAACQRHARGVMGLGLYCDLAVGASEGGSEVWSRRSLFALGLHVGAPPDPLNALGQDWGLPPINPGALVAEQFAPFIELLRYNMQHAGALRLDHVMGLMRLYWTRGGNGTYVAYPLEPLLAILAVESHRQQCMVIGEDLGNVAPAMRDAMARRGLLSYRPLIFERTEAGAFRPPQDWQPQALAVVTTHDLPTLRGYWLGDDVETAARLNLLPEPDSHARQVLARAHDRAHLLMALNEQHLLPEGATMHPPSLPDATTAFVAAVHGFLARTPCWLAAVQLEDVVGQREQVNVPGTTEDVHPNWRRRIAVALEDIAGDGRLATVAAAMRAGRPAATAGHTPGSASALADLPALDTADIPRATYRVQFHAGCTFADVTRAADYLQALGVSHLYASPYLTARPGSTHGYDVIDPTRINPEVGTPEEHAALCDALATRGMGQVLDIVPNHMGVLEAHNPWWQDVLEHGRASPHADTFDIEWQPAAPEMRDRVLLPILGDAYGRVLEAGELQVRFDALAGQFCVHYWGHHAPIDPAHYAGILASQPVQPVQSQDNDQVRSLLDAFTRLPGRDAATADERAIRLRDAALHKRSLAALAAEHEWLRQWIDACLRRLNGHAGDPRSFDALDALLQKQAYRLADWRVAGDDINYRRFFDINGLAAVNMDRAPVFDAMHGLILQWLAEGKITGLRIDHPDGLSEPAAYFMKLQRRHAALASSAGREVRALYLVVEKILADHEALPEEWPVHGGTGYRFSSLVNGLFVDPSAEAAFDEAYAAFTGDTQSFEAIVHDCKKLVIGQSLSSELGWLTETLYRIARADRSTCDFTRNRLREVLAEVAAAFPVYRTYVGASGYSGVAGDAQHIAWAVAAARRRLGTADAQVLGFVEGVLLGEAGALPSLHRRFIARWQQFTAPVMAKAMEDTAFYRYVRLVSLNDVGSEPRRFGVSAAAFHNANVQRARRRPHWLLATSTHDSKRSEDVRARLNVLSEIPQEWAEAASRLSEIGERFRSEVDGAAAPCRHDEWALFQALAGIWPVAPAGPGAASVTQDLRERVQRYMLKAAREAKRETNWINPNEAYETALRDYIDQVLSLDAFVAGLQALVTRIAPLGWRNSLAQLALKLTAPGVPDIYQGCEEWNFSLVDPDNRRPVDYSGLADRLKPLRQLYEKGYPSRSDWQRLLPAAGHGSMVQQAPAGIKQLVTWRLLQLRALMPELFRNGNYLPLAVEQDSEGAEHAIAFARIREGRAIVIVVARLLDSLGAQGWRGATIQLNAHPVLEKSRVLRNWMTGVDVPAPADGRILLEQLLGTPGVASSDLPFAVFTCES
ncbi:malto-oligosyltrehalose synthase [Variovorax sp. VNK109]|uniref:malto-oligosyltrehalose synthase n=1 Tax=Variovorax sp. VNK109 TaxID=3400919 RepID=UPI003C0EAEEB